MNSNFTNSGWQTGVNAVAAVVCEGTVAAEQAAAGDTMSSENDFD
jgi:1,4-dihydroxy-2-naphthoyl-CoA synthase